MQSRSSARGGALFAGMLAQSGIEQLPMSALKLIEGAVRVLGSRGMSDLSIESVCKVSGVSRATLYRYFSTKDDLLDAAGEFICLEFEAGVAIEAERHQDPVKRFAGIMDFLMRYTAERGLTRIFEADPSFHLVFFRSHFARHCAAVQTALDPVFDWRETLAPVVIDRAASAERLVRLQLSRLLIPFDTRLNDAWNRASTDADTVMQHWIIAYPKTIRAKRRRNVDRDRRPE